MVKIIFLLKRAEGVSPEQFRAHYESSHVKLAQKYIGHLLVDYVRNYPAFAMRNPSDVPASAMPAPYDIGYDCITEMYVKDQAAVEKINRIFNDPEINPILAEDELKFLKREETVMIMTDVVNTGVKLAA
ncbi:EthD domain-containing protein [Flavisphingomonas formosensis]|uniref:EthD domain-containing protein n=1 Tax=Flavisphingomonas formosensis TaxID=861534 RepID=UPI0012FC8699|nr:EthD domain-containing protein [Sphingomonas formosensis]